VIATVDGVRTQGKAALREVEAVFKKLHEELEVRKAEVIEEVKRTASQKEKELLFQKDDVEFVVSGLRHVLEVGEVTLREGSEGDIVVGKVQISMRMETLLGIPLGSEPICDETVAFEGGGELAVKSIREIGKVNKGRSIRTGENKERVYRRDYTKVDAPVLQLGQKGIDDGCFQSPSSLVFNSKGEIVVADTDNHRIQVFDGAGKILWKFGSKGSGNGQFDTPYGVTFDHRNHQIVVADSSNHRIQICDEKGTFIRTFGSNGAANGQFESPDGVAIDKEANYVVASNHCIQVFDSAGKFKEVWIRRGWKWPA